MINKITDKLLLFIFFLFCIVLTVSADELRCEYTSEKFIGTLEFNSNGKLIRRGINAKPGYSIAENVNFDALVNYYKDKQPSCENYMYVKEISSDSWELMVSPSRPSSAVAVLEKTRAESVKIDPPTSNETVPTTSITPPEPGPAPQINTGPAAPIQREAQQTFHLGDDPKIRDICESSGFLTVLHMVLIIVNILKLAVPLVLIGMLTMDIYPLIGNPGEVSKVVKKSKNRLIAAILIFFVPTIMQIILNALGDSTTVSTCYDHATDTGYIEDRKNAEKAYFKGNTSSSSQNGGSNNGNSGGGSTWRSDDDGGFDSRSGKF